MPIIAKLLSSGLGMTSEAIHKARDGSSSNRPTSSHPPSSSSQGSPPEYSQVPAYDAHGHYPAHGSSQQSSADASELAIHQEGQANDEVAWELDDMAERVRLPSKEEAADTSNEPEEEKIKKREAMVRNLVSMAGPAPQPTQRLPCPVILPQRRPRQKDRGFVRAYAPVLSDCGIDQDVFIRFIEDLDTANKASKWLDVVFVAGNVVGFVPTMATQVTSIVVQIIAGTAREFQGRSRGNTYLDRVNQEVFIPRGLVAMAMQFKDELPGQQQSGPLGSLSSSIQKTFFTKERLDMDQTAAKYGNPDPNVSRLSRGMNTMRLTNGKTYGEAELPESAPLVYPDLDRAIHTLAAENMEGDIQGQGPNSSSIKDKFKSAGEWTNDYLDRRAHAFYEAEHPGTSLTISADNRAPMKSRFNDPNHAANSGSIISLLTGGHIAKQGLPQRLAARREQMGRGLGRSSQGPKPRGLLKQKPVKKLLQKDVFYLLVVNIPSQEEVQQSVARLEHIMGQAGATSFSR